MLVSLDEAREEPLGDLLLFLRHEHGHQFDEVGLHNLALALARLDAEGLVVVPSCLVDGDWVTARYRPNEAGDWRWQGNSKEPTVILTDAGQRALQHSG